MNKTLGFGIILYIIGNFFPINNSQIALKPTSKDSIPPSGKYIYDIAFAEWVGISMGCKVQVIINVDSVIVIYLGPDNLSYTQVGDTLEIGIIRKHQHGKWIITSKESDIYYPEVGGCTGGPTVLDFTSKLYWMC